MRAATDAFPADNGIESGRICTVPNTNDWYLTADDGITLGPYRSREEAVAILALLRRQRRLASTSTD